MLRAYLASQEQACQAGPSRLPLRHAKAGPPSHPGKSFPPCSKRFSHSSSRTPAQHAEPRGEEPQEGPSLYQRRSRPPVAHFTGGVRGSRRSKEDTSAERPELLLDLATMPGYSAGDLFIRRMPGQELRWDTVGRCLVPDGEEPRDWPFVTPRPEQLFRDAYLARPDRFDWRLRRSSLLRTEAVSNHRPAASDRKSWPVQRRKPSAPMLKGEEGKMTEKGRRWRERALRKQGLSLQDIHAEAKRLEARREDRARIRDGADAYRKHWSAILDLERAVEVNQIKERIKSPIGKLIEDGLAFDGLQAYWQDDNRRHFGKRVAMFKLFGAQELPRNQFKVGDKVTIAPSASSDAVGTGGRTEAIGDAGNPGLEEELRIEAEIVEKQKTYLRLKFNEEDEKTDLVGCPSWRLDHGYNDLTFDRMQAALQAIDHDVEFVESQGGLKFQNMLSGTRLNDLILGTDPPKDRTTRGAFWEDARIQSWYDRYSRKDPLVIDGDPDMGLNESQTRAIAMMLKERISLVQGPPGTGKTRTIVQAIKLLKHHFQAPHPILLAAHTNVAVDNLAEGCMKAGLKVVRVGPSSRARSGIEAVTLDAYFIRHPLKARLDDIKRHLDVLEKVKGDLEASLRLRGGGGAGSAAARSSSDSAAQAEAIDSEWEELLAENATDVTASETPDDLEAVKLQLNKRKRSYFFLRATIRGQILNDADVICGSSIAAGSPELDMVDFPVVFFDEGSMATEPVSLIPLMKGCRHLSIIGDHKQLPPVVTSTEAKEAGLSRSLFERLIENKDGRRPASSTMLDVQFRMHPSLAEYPVRTFYDGVLASGESTASIQPVQSTFLPTHRKRLGDSAVGGHGDGATASLSTTATAGQYLGFVDHTGRESKAENHSLLNHAEARLTLEILVDLLQRNPTLKGSEIGIVTPYLGQQILLEKLLHSETSRDRIRAIDLLGGDATRASELSEVDIHTVDGFEGREKRVILFSTVRTNPAGYVGFLADGRRLNVALTRAQSCLLVLGSVQTLRNARLSESAAAKMGGGASKVDSPNVEALRGYAEYLLDRGLVVDAEQRVRELKVQRGEIEAVRPADHEEESKEADA